ncbi:MAG: hypothetical protein Q9181_006385, partial [Wetmoreana brouardii]
IRCCGRLFKALIEVTKIVISPACLKIVKVIPKAVTRCIVFVRRYTVFVVGVIV